MEELLLEWRKEEGLSLYGSGENEDGLSVKGSARFSSQVKRHTDLSLLPVAVGVT